MSTLSSPSTVRELFDRLGREKIVGKLFGEGEEHSRKGQKSLSQSAWKNSIPSSWFKVISELCAKEGVEVPQDLFAFREAEAVSSPATAESDQ